MWRRGDPRSRRRRRQRAARAGRPRSPGRPPAVRATVTRRRCEAAVRSSEAFHAGRGRAACGRPAARVRRPRPDRRRARRAVGGERQRRLLRFDVKAAGRQLRRSRATASSSRRRRPSVASTELSGGNIQRVLLTLALGEPHRGARGLLSDPRARRPDHREHRRSCSMAAERRARRSCSISEDLDELLALSDRIAVLAHGRCAGVVAAAERRPAAASVDLMTAHAS